MDMLQFEVLDGAKAHVGKVLNVEVLALTDSSHLAGGTSLRGRTELNGKVYECVILEYSEITHGILEHGFGSKKFGRVIFNSLKLI